MRPPSRTSLARGIARVVLLLSIVRPSAVAAAEATSLWEPAPWHQPTHVDVGAGVALGVTSGLKLRLLAVLDSGLSLGLDLDAGTIGLVSDATANAFIGYDVQPARQTVRLYLTVGGGPAKMYSDGIGAAMRATAGAEWRATRWIGLGAEAGVITYSPAEGRMWAPESRLTVISYLP
jgi:hypothetical protein